MSTQAAPFIMRNPLRQPTAKAEMGDMVMLAKILSWMRPHNSDAEEQFIHDYIDCLDAEADDFGNRFIRLGTAPILYSAHVDTVHRNGGYQRLTVHKNADETNIDFRVREDDGNCLGADDGTGVWLLIQMLKANKPGLYVFHRGEECGCLGSRHISTKEQDLLKGIHYAVAFDRRGYNSVITHQRGTRCCSDKFAQALATKLGGDFKADSTGLFTDTGEYTKLIPECTNLSVGYFNQHMRDEYQNIGFARKLRDRILELNFLDLPQVRDPKHVEYASYSQGAYGTPAKSISEMSFYELVSKHPFCAVELLKKLGATEEEMRLTIEPWRKNTTSGSSSQSQDDAELHYPYGY